MMYADFPKVSDIGQVWGWGYGGEGQLGLGSRIRMVSSPHPIPCIESSAYGKDRSAAMSRGGMTEGQGYRAPGSYVKGIACGGRHSAVITGRSIISTLFLFLSSFVVYNNIDMIYVFQIFALVLTLQRIIKVLTFWNQLLQILFL